MSWSAGSGRGGTVCPPAGFPPDPCRTVGAVINRPGDSAGVPAGQCAPHSLFGCAKKRTRRARCKRKRRRARSGAVALRAYGGRRTSACSDFSWHSGTLGPSVRSILPSRGGWCRQRRGARMHSTSFSFRAFRFARRCLVLRGSVSGSGERGRGYPCTSPGWRFPQGRRVSVSDCRKGLPTFPRRRQEGCACAGRPAEHVFFSTGRGAFSF